MAAPLPIRITFFGSSTSDDFAEAGNARQYLQSIYSISLESFNDPQKLWDHMSEKRKAGQECLYHDRRSCSRVIRLDALPYMSLVYALICISFTVLFVFGVISDFEATDGALVDTFTDAFYIASVMVFTVGFGDIVPWCRSIFLCDMLSMFGGGLIQFILNHFPVFDDIKSALDVWSDILTSDGSMMPENTMCGQIIYAVTDMLSLKGRVDYHHTIYKVMSVIYTRRGVRVDNLLAKLWGFRRLSHALCPSPVQEAFMSLSDVFGEKLKSNDFWIECLSGSQLLKVGFENSFSASQSSTTVINCNLNSI
ncbi:hypothetical protein ACLB2K_076956 [Fragaria x ananassa]